MFYDIFTTCHSLTNIASSWLLLAADEAAAPAGDAAPEGFQGLPLTMLLPLILLMFYFLVLRPQQKSQNESRTQLETLKAKDRVVTIGGIHGVVTNVQREQEVATIRVDESTGAKMKVSLSAIKDIVTDEEKEKASS